jgi:hypothetical protein
MHNNHGRFGEPFGGNFKNRETPDIYRAYAQNVIYSFQSV